MRKHPSETATVDDSIVGDPWGGTSRREFLRLAATGMAVLAAPSLLSGCHVLGAAGRQKLDFGDDFGVINFAYALETLEADFYTRVVASQPPDLHPGELETLREIRDHEVQHQRFFKRALNVLRIHVPARNFAGVDFTTRQGVLQQARTFEDLGVAGYNGAGDRIRLAEFLTIAGKIVSVEARHAAAIRDMLDPMSRAFAGDDVVDAQGMDRLFPPAEVLAQVQRYFQTPFHVTNL